MERLIKKHFGIYVPTAMINKNTSAVKPCGSTCNEYREDCGICPIRTVFNRLAEYKATGLTPQEIMDGKLLTGWIPVSERLPGLYETVLVTAIGIEDEESLVYEGARQGDDKWELCGVGNPDYYKVLAWMPLPETWKGE